MNRIIQSILITILTLFFSLGCFAEETQPFNAIQFITQTFDEYPIICLTEGSHASRPPHRFFHEMLLDEEFQLAVNVIIVEFASADYQSVLDAYIFGDEIPYVELMQVWHNTSQGEHAPWSHPVYFELLELVREINQTLPEDEKIRVLGGDPPMDWEASVTGEYRVSRRDAYPSELAIEQAFTHHKHVLIIFGGAHLPKVPTELNGEIHYNLTNMIQVQYPDGVYAIDFINPKNDLLKDKLPEFEKGMIYPTNTHWIGEISADFYFPGLFFRDGTRANLYEDYLFKDMFDALIYIGRLD